MRKFNKIASAIILSASALMMTSVAAKSLFSQDRIPQIQTQEYIVTFDLSVKGAAMSKSEFMAIQKLNLTKNGHLTIKKTFKHSGAMLIQANQATVARLKMDQSVLSISKNRVIKDIPKKKRTKQLKAHVNDNLQKQYNNLASWGIDRVDQRYLTLDGKYNTPRGGAGVTAYILDTGTVASTNEFDDATGQTRLRMGYNPFRDDFESTDCHGHGSHVAGTVGGTNYGIAKDVNLVAVRVMECGEVKTVANIIEGMEWVMSDVAAHQGPAVVNMSLSDPEGSVAWDNATQAMIDSGITVVVAAGNNFYDACINSPARLSDAITVGATDKYDHYNNLSNYGECVDILAPGSSITSLDENGQSWTISGTSMAAPHVTGAAALVLELHPDFNHHQVKEYLLDHATQGVISGTAGDGDTLEPSANRLLYIGDDLGQPLPQSVVNAGYTVQVELLEGGYAYYKTQLGEGAEQLTIEISAEDEVDLFVKYDDVPSANPINFHNDCKQTHFGGNEVCDFSLPDAGDWHILIASSNPDASIQLNVAHDSDVVDICDTNPQSQACVCENNPGDPICDPVVEPSVVELLNLSDLGSSDQLVYQVDVPAGKTLTVTTSGGTGDAELFVNYFEQADTWWSSDCYSRNSGSDEQCTITQTQQGIYYIVLDAYTSFDNVTLLATYQ